MTLDDEDIERIAVRVAELLQEEDPSGARFVDAAVVARKLGVDRDWVYEHARELGGVRLEAREGGCVSTSRRSAVASTVPPSRGRWKSAAPGPENARRDS